LVLSLFFVFPVRGNDIYVAPSAAGSGNGTDCADAYAYAFFNAAENWGSGSTKIGPGTTVHLCAGTYGGSVRFNGSGTSSAPITLKFETGAVMSSPVWSGDSGAISSNGYSYLVIDGGTNGIIQDTLNGDSGAACLGGRCSQQLYTQAIVASGSSYVEIKDITCRDMYIHVAPNNADMNQAPGCIYINSTAGGAGNISIHDNVMHDVTWNINLFDNLGPNISIYNNDIYNFDHGIAIGLDGCSPSCAVSSVYVHDNHIHDPANWDTSDNFWHHDGIHFFDNAGTSEMDINGVYIYNNLFDGNWGNNFTAQVYCQDNPGTIENVAAYNNVFSMPNATHQGDGLWACGNSSPSSGVFRFYNNAMIGNPSYRISCLVTANDTVDVRNNVFASCLPVNDYNMGGLALPVISSWDHNIYEDPMGYWGWGANTYTTFAQWQAACNCDKQGSRSVSSLYITDMGGPTSGSPALNAGSNLCDLLSCSASLTSLADDTSAGDTRKPVARPTGTAAWDAGAYQLSNVNLPLAPTGLTATVE
jgi:hypothetical protein